MDMDMFWPQQEVFLMGTLALFSKRLIGKPIKPHGELSYFFDSKDLNSLALQFNKYKDAGYIEFVEQSVKVLSLNPNGSAPFGKQTVSFTIHEVDIKKVTADLTKYLENWQNNKLTTSTAFKPDDYEHQHVKLLATLKQAYNRQEKPHITISDIYGDDFTTSYNYELPFWEVVLAPHFVSKEYVIRQLNYDLNGRGQPYMAIEITDHDLQRSLKKVQPAHKELAELKIINNILHIRLDSGEQYELKKFRTDSAPANFVDYMSSHPDTDIPRATVQMKVEGCAQKQDMTELVRHCGFTGDSLPLKDAFFAGTTEKKAHFVSKVLLTTEQVNLIASNLTKSN